MFRSMLFASMAVVALAGSASADGWSISVSTGTTEYPVNVDGGQTVAQLKELLATLTGIPAYSQILTFDGTELTDEQTFVNLGVQDGSTLSLEAGGTDTTGSTDDIVPQDEPQQDDVPNDQSTDQPQQDDVPGDQSTDQPQQDDVPGDQSTDQPQQDDVPNDQSTDQPQQDDVPDDQSTDQPQQDDGTPDVQPTDDQPDSDGQPTDLGNDYADWEDVIQTSQKTAMEQLQSLVFMFTSRVYNRLAPADRDGMYMASSGGDPEWSFWVDTSLADMAGSGAGGNIAVGADRGLGAGIVGVYAALNRTEGGAVQTLSPSLGLYLGLPLGDRFVLDGHLGVTYPRYDAGYARFGDRRVTGSVGITGRWEEGGIVLSPGVHLSGFDESVPAVGQGEADSLSYRSVEAALRVEGAEPLGAAGLTPYAELAVAQSVMESDLSGRETGGERRAVLGIQGSPGRGTVSAEVSALSGLDGDTRAQVALRWTVGF